MLSQEYFHTVEPIKKKVSKEEFQTFLDNYPRKLTYDWTGIFEPPAISYNDFELANRWPYSVVAHTWAYSDDPDGVIEAANRRKLESLGYKISAGSQYNESYFTINW